MEYKFDAFISYRHAEVDSAVAKDIQHWLEHFHVPKAIQITSGKKKINRVFRDKEELPLSMNLGETITDALIHSEYLIVICSPRTKESQWVQREIEAFLETHDLEHVLAVIAEGEPDDVIPKILTYKETTSVNENGEEITVKEDLEPLGCDYRVGKRKAHKEELPRLAASLLHCSYDNLIQRARQYRMRVISGILATVLALALCIIGYVLYSNQQIKTNYENALRNQSEYLASESLKSLNNKDRFTAMALALEALPSETNDRPYVAKAEYALSESTLAYCSGSLTKNNLIPSATFNVDATITDLCADKSYIAILDRSNIISIFDSKDNRFVNRIQLNFSDTIKLIGLSKNHQLLFYSGPNLFCYSLPDCKESWNYTGKTKYYKSDLRTPVLLEKEVIISHLDDGGEAIVRINLNTGEENRRYHLPSFPDSIPGLTNTDPGIISKIGSANANKLPLLIHAKMDSNYFLSSNDIPAVLDLETGTVTYYPQNPRYPLGISLTNDGDLIVYSIDDLEKSSAIYGGVNFMYTTTNYITRIDSASKSVVWEFEEKTGQLLDGNEIKCIPYPKGDSSEIDGLFLTFSDRLFILDSANGALLNRVETPGAIVDCECWDDGYCCITREGYFCFSGYSSEQALSYQPFQNPINSGWVKNGIILIPSNQSVIRYNFNVSDKNSYPIDYDIPSNKNAGFFSIPTDSLINDNSIGLLYDQYLLYSEGILSQKLKCLDISNASGRLKSFIGQLPNGNYLINRSEYGKTPIIEIESKTGNIHQHEIPGLKDAYHNIKDIQLVEDTLFYSYYQDDETDYSKKHLYFAYYNYEEKKPVRVDLGFEKDVVDLKMSVSDDKNAALVIVSKGSNENHKAIMVNLSNGSVKELKINASKNEPKYCWFVSEKSSPLLAIAEDDSITIWNNSARKEFTISDIPGMIYDILYMDDGTLLCVITKGNKTGELLHYSQDYSLVQDRTEIPLPLFSGNNKWNLIDDHFLIIQSNNVASIIDIDQWQLLSEVPNCYGYQNNNDCFICIDTINKKTNITYKTRYTTESLIAEAKRQLGDFKLSDNQRAEYGLD